MSPEYVKGREKEHRQSEFRNKRTERFVIRPLSTSLRKELADKVSVDNLTEYDRGVLEAARSGDVAGVIYNILMGGDINARDEDGNTVGHLAVENDDPRLLREYHYLGGRWFAKNNSGDTVLMSAYVKGTLKKMVKMLKDDVSIESFDPNDLKFCVYEGLSDRDKAEFEVLLNSANIEVDPEEYVFLVFLKNFLKFP